MKILHYGTEQDFLSVSNVLSHMPDCKDSIKEYAQQDNYDDFLNALTDHYYNLIIVTVDNALGMEGVIAAKNCHPELPLIWFSNDKGFGLQSYRLGCAYFGARPITADKMERALKRCRQQLRIS